MKKMNNKGFSLVELIIVIAIMAILLVVLAPQYLKYVERSRNSTDLQNAAEFVSAIQIYAADPDAAKTPETGTITITSNAAGAMSNDFIKAALEDAGLLDSSKALQTRCQSKTEWTGYTITATVATGGAIQFSYDSTGDDDDTFAARMAGATTAAPATP